MTSPLRRSDSGGLQCWVDWPDFTSERLVPGYVHRRRNVECGGMRT